MGSGPEAWQVYLVVGLILAILEAFAPGFVLLPIGLAFLMTSFFSYFVGDLVWQLTFLAIAGTGTFFWFRLIARRSRQMARVRSNVDDMIGKMAIVEVEINNQAGQGYAKLYGDSWRAMSSTGEVFPKGAQVVIERVEGNKIWVSPK